MKYLERRPEAPELRLHVDCYWTLRGSAADRWALRVLPDGCLDLLFDLSNDVEASVVGVMTAAVVTPTARFGASVDLLGVRFRPGEAPAWLGVLARETRDGAFALRDVCGCWGVELTDRLRDVDTPGERFAVLDAALLARGRRFATDRRLRAAMGELARGRCPVSAVAERVGLGERHLLRLFDDHVGLGPRAFARVMRLQRLVVEVDGVAHGEPSWAGLAAACGFADQPHLVREVRKLAGVAPFALFRERACGRLGMSETSNPPAAVLDTVGT